MTNIEAHRVLLRNLYKKIEVKDYIYNYIRYEMREYTRFSVSLRKMLECRTNKLGGTKNGIIGLATSIGNSRRLSSINEYITFFKEAAKVNIMDIDRIRKNYNIKSKNLLNLLDRLEKFEDKNIKILNSLYSGK